LSVNNIVNPAQKPTSGSLFGNSTSLFAAAGNNKPDTEKPK